MLLPFPRLRVVPFVAALLSAAAGAVTAEPAPEASLAGTSDPAVRCEMLAEIVADVCPQRCVRKHCTQRCIPPLNEDGRCGRCQDHCARICESQADMRFAACGAPDETGSPAGQGTTATENPADQEAAEAR